MPRGFIYQPYYRPLFTGHETFPLRYGWLKKAYDRVIELNDTNDNKKICWGEDAVAKFGVGKNMVSSIRHWALVTDVLHEPSGLKVVEPTELGDIIFGKNGIDPYMENPSTLWFFHWKLATQWEKKTTWCWVFNHYASPTFERFQILQQIFRLAKEMEWPRVSQTTLKHDVACFIRTYVAQTAVDSIGADSSLECPLTELGLIKSIGKLDGFRLVRGPKPSLGDGVFLFALMEFWRSHSSHTTTLSFEAVAHEPGSPGRVFLLDDNDVVDRLVKVEDQTNGSLRWSETAGIKQIVRKSDFDLEDALKFIKYDYLHAF